MDRVLPFEVSPASARVALTSRHRPRNCVWELTLDCNLNCVHCGSSAGRARHAELSTEEALDVVRQLRDLGCELVTLSGGEPLSQPQFSLALLKACKEEGLHTAIETAGYAHWKQMESVLEFVDLVMFDIKHLDSELHRKTTGVENARILENLRKTAKGSRLWLRVPLLAGFNDSESHIQQVARLGMEIGAEKISLLPYHDGGKSKSEQLGIGYTCPQGRTPREKHLNKLRQVIEQTGLAVSLGN